MTKQEKQLLLIDLCARLQHGVDLQINKKVTERLYSIVKNRNTEVWFVNGVNVDLIEIKPYLRPMSSMTEEEYEEFCKTDKLMVTLLEINKLGIQGTRECHLMVAKALGERVTEQQNWLNSHHFDYRGLIPMGLSLEAPKGMYK